MDRRNDVAAACGTVAPLVALGTFAVGAAVADGYAWPGEPFSVIGAAGGPVAAGFNAGLVATGLLALPFATRLWRAASPAVGLAYAVVGVSFAGAGLVPIGGLGGAHELFGAGIFVGIWLLLWADGVVAWRRGDRRRAVASLALGTVAVAVWLPYDLGLAWAQIGWGAAELVAVACLAGWSLATARRLRRGAVGSSAAAGGPGE